LKNNLQFIVPLLSLCSHELVNSFSLPRGKAQLSSDYHPKFDQFHGSMQDEINQSDFAQKNDFLIFIQFTVDFKE
jgi:hypothetical protein